MLICGRIRCLGVAVTVGVLPCAVVGCVSDSDDEPIRGANRGGKGGLPGSDGSSAGKRTTGGAASGGKKLSEGSQVKEGRTGDAMGGGNRAEVTSAGAAGAADRSGTLLGGANSGGVGVGDANAAGTRDAGGSAGFAGVGALPGCSGFAGIAGCVGSAGSAGELPSGGAAGAGGTSVGATAGTGAGGPGSAGASGLGGSAGSAGKPEVVVFVEGVEVSTFLGGPNSGQNNVPTDANPDVVRAATFDNPVNVIYFDAPDGTAHLHIADSGNSALRFVMLEPDGTPRSVEHTWSDPVRFCGPSGLVVGLFPDLYAATRCGPGIWQLDEGLGNVEPELLINPNGRPGGLAYAPPDAEHPNGSLAYTDCESHTVQVLLQFRLKLKRRSVATHGFRGGCRSSHQLTAVLESESSGMTESTFVVPPARGSFGRYRFEGGWTQ
ncbi:hypothetical protein ACFL5O_07810 [Myxococcota bacterium]